MQAGLVALLGGLAVAPLVRGVADSYTHPWISVTLTFAVVSVQVGVGVGVATSQSSTAGLMFIPAMLAGGIMWIVATGLDDVVGVRKRHKGSED